MPDPLRTCIAAATLMTGLAISPNALANTDTQPGTLPDGWPASARASAFYQCHFGARGHNQGSVMVWADARHRVVALSSPRADEPVPAWTRRVWPSWIDCCCAACKACTPI